jgi:hypothetical protein
MLFAFVCFSSSLNNKQSKATYLIIELMNNRLFTSRLKRARRIKTEGMLERLSLLALITKEYLNTRFELTPAELCDFIGC